MSDLPDADGNRVCFYMDNGFLGGRDGLFDDNQREEWQNELNDPNNLLNGNTTNIPFDNNMQIFVPPRR